jgi:hypothetical protein
VSSNEASFLEEEMERKRSKQMSANKNNKNGDHCDNDNNSSDNNNSKSDEKDKEKEKDERSYSMDDCVLSTSIMHMWGYPLPPTPTLTLPCSTSCTAPLATSIAASSTTSSLKSGSHTQAINNFGENTSEKRSRDENMDSEDGNIPKKIRTENSETKNLSENMVSEKIVNNQEDSGVKNMELETKNGNENENLKEAVVEVEVVWSDDMPIGATIGVIPTMREMKNIFNLKVSTQGEGEDVGSGIKGPESVATDCVEMESGKGAVGGGEGAETGAGGGFSSTLPPLSLPLLYPSFEPLIQSTRGPNSGGPGITGYRETVSQHSEKFKTLWMSSTVNTRT